MDTPKCLEHTFERLKVACSTVLKSRGIFLSPDGYLAPPRSRHGPRLAALWNWLGRPKGSRHCEVPEHSRSPGGLALHLLHALQLVALERDGVTLLRRRGSDLHRRNGVTRNVQKTAATLREQLGRNLSQTQPRIRNSLTPSVLSTTSSTKRILVQRRARWDEREAVLLHLGVGRARKVSVGAVRL